MKCPVDGEALVISERSGVEIDYCPSCRGVWLDRGELDKIIRRNDQVLASSPGRDDRRRDHRYDYSDDDDRYDDRYGDRGRGKRRKRESFLSELFDFG